MTITNEEEALQSLRRAARDANSPAPVDKLSIVLNGVIPAVRKFADAIGEDLEVALFIGEAFCWFFSNRTAIRATIAESQSASEITYYKTDRDFGPITFARDSTKVSVRIAGRVWFGRERSRSRDPVPIRPGWNQRDYTEINSGVYRAQPAGRRH